MRLATPVEVTPLEDLIARSLSHWGYSESEASRGRGSTFVATEGFQRQVTIAEQHPKIVGLYALDIKQTYAEVGLFFVDRPYIGRGIGRMMWEHLLAAAQDIGVTTIALGAEPGATGFYTRMGLRRDSEIESGGRRLIWMNTAVTLPRTA